MNARRNRFVCTGNYAATLVIQRFDLHDHFQRLNFISSVIPVIQAREGRLSLYDTSLPLNQRDESGRADLQIDKWITEKRTLALGCVAFVRIVKQFSYPTEYRYSPCAYAVMTAEDRDVYLHRVRLDPRYLGNNVGAVIARAVLDHSEVMDRPRRLHDEEGVLRALPAYDADPSVGPQMFGGESWQDIRAARTYVADQFRCAFAPTDMNIIYQY